MTSPVLRPPRLAAWLLERIANRDETAAILGDFTEEYREIAARRGEVRARIWYWRLVAVSLPSFLRDALNGSLIMLKNYLTVAGRNFRRQKGFSAINVVGLALGMACSLLIAIFVKNELSFDRFHENASRIYRVGVRIGEWAGNFRGAFTAPPLAAALKSELPEAEQVVRMSLWPRNVLIRAGENSFLEKGLIYADAGLFQTFSFRFLSGDPETALSDPGSVVLTRSAAEKYFRGRDPLGLTLHFEDADRDYKVTGLIEDCPANSHFRFSMIGSLCSLSSSRSTSWGSHTFFTYVLLSRGSTPAGLEAKLPGFVRKYYADHFRADTGRTLDELFEEDENYYAHFLEPLTAIHLNTDIGDQLSVKGSPLRLAVFSALAVLALLLAGTNYMNLSTARFSRRSREVGIRKVLGSNRKQLVIQFLGESILISLISTGLAWILVLLALPVFSQLADRTLSPGLLAGSFTLPVSVVFAVAVGVLAGLYPAFFLSALRPAQSVKGRGGKSGGRTLGLRRILVILQFAGSAAVLFGTLVIARQMSFFRSRELGFDKERVLVIHRASAVGLERAEAFKRELLRLPSVQAVSHTDGLPGGHFEPNGTSVVGRPLSEQYVLQTLCADDDFDAIIGLRMEEGRYFSPELSSDPDEVVINRTAARQLAFDEPLGQRFYKTPKTYYTVVGVVADFHFFSLHHEILPMAIRRWDGSRWYYTAVRLRPGPLNDSLAAIERAWKDFTGGQPFEFSFLDSDFDALYRGEIRTGRIFSILTGTAIFIACMGLFGLVSYTAQRRTKEIGVRKVLGASSARMVLMLSREVLCLAALSVLIALPPAAWAMHRWLRNFAYRIGIGPGLFAAAALTMLAVALAASAWQTVRTARENPAEILRCE